MIKAIIFDVDGTLVNSVDSHAHAWQDAFNAFGHDFAFDKIRSQIGKGGAQLMPVFLSHDEVEAQGPDIERFRAGILKERYFPKIHGFPKVRELFEKLIAANIQIVLASSAKKDELQFYKQAAGIEDLVEKETSSDDADKSKPHPDIFESALALLHGIDKTDILVVGDTPYDAEAAGKIGLRTVGVLCGGFAEEDLRAAGCVAIYLQPICWSGWPFDAVSDPSCRESATCVGRSPLFGARLGGSVPEHRSVWLAHGRECRRTQRNNDPPR